MITVRLYGLLRLDSGIREKQLEAENVAGVLRQLEECGIDAAALNGCAIFVNGKGAKKRSKLTDGDTVALLPPVAGG